MLLNLNVKAVDRPIKYSTESLISYLLVATEILGRVPTQRAFKKLENFPSYDIYAKRFGSWNKALKTAGLAPNRKIYNAEELLIYYPLFIRKFGYEPTFTDLHSTQGFPSNTAIVTASKKWNRYKKEVMQRYGKWITLKINDKLRPFSRAALNTYFSPHIFNEVVADAQAEPGARRFGGMKGLK